MMVTTGVTWIINTYILPYYLVYKLVGNYNKGPTASKVCSNIINTQIIVWIPILFNLELGAGNITNTVD